MSLDLGEIDGKANKNFPQFQFSDGSVTYCLSGEWFEIIEGLDEYDEAFEDYL